MFPISLDAQALNVRMTTPSASQPPLVIADLMRRPTHPGQRHRGQRESGFITGKINQGQGTIGALVNDKKITPARPDHRRLRDTVTHASGSRLLQENMDAMKQNVLLRGYFKKRGYGKHCRLVKNEIPQLPQTTPLKTFTFNSKELFDKLYKAKPKNRILRRRPVSRRHGIRRRVVVVSTALPEIHKDLVLAQARAMVVRDYLVGNFLL